MNIPSEPNLDDVPDLDDEAGGNYDGGDRGDADAAAKLSASVMDTE